MSEQLVKALEHIAQPDGKGHPPDCSMRRDHQPCSCDEEIARQALAAHRAAQAERDDEAERLLERLVRASDHLDGLHNKEDEAHPFACWQAAAAARDAARRHVAARRAARGES